MDTIAAPAAIGHNTSSAGGSFGGGGTDDDDDEAPLPVDDGFAEKARVLRCCSGGDVKRMNRDADQSAPPTPAAALDALKTRHQGIGGALRSLLKPTVAALPGAAAGAGLD